MNHIYTNLEQALLDVWGAVGSPTYLPDLLRYRLLAFVVPTTVEQALLDLEVCKTRGEVKRSPIYLDGVPVSGEAPLIIPEGDSRILSLKYKHAVVVRDPRHTPTCGLFVFDV